MECLPSALDREFAELYAEEGDQGVNHSLTTAGLNRITVTLRIRRSFEVCRDKRERRSIATIDLFAWPLVHGVRARAGGADRPLAG